MREVTNGVLSPSLSSIIECKDWRQARLCLSNERKSLVFWTVIMCLMSAMLFFYSENISFYRLFFSSWLPFSYVNTNKLKACQWKKNQAGPLHHWDTSWILYMFLTTKISQSFFLSPFCFVYNANTKIWTAVCWLSKGNKLHRVWTRFHYKLNSYVTIFT